VELGAAAESTVQAYRTLAEDRDKRLHLALDDTCLQFLSLVVGNGAPPLAAAALSTLAALAESPECRAPMAATFGVLHCLKACVEEDNQHPEAMKNEAIELFTCLNFALHERQASRRRSKLPQEVKAETSDKKKPKHRKEALAEETEPKSSQDAKSKDEGMAGEAAGADTKEVKTKEDKTVKTKEVKEGIKRSESMESTASTVSQPSQRSANTEEKHRQKYYRDPKHRTRMVTLYVKGMTTPEHREAVEGALVRVRGLISLVFDVHRARIEARVRRVLELQRLGQAVERLDRGLGLFQVLAKRGGEEVHIPLTSTPRSPSDPPPSESETEPLPDYLPEEDDDCQPTDDPNSAVSTTGAIKEAASSLFSAAASYISSSFYW